MILCGNCHVSFSVVPQPCYLTTNQWTSKPLYLEYTESTALMSLPRITSCWCYNMLWKVLMLSILLQNSSIFLHPGLKSTCWSERPLVSVHTKAAKEVLTPPRMICVLARWGFCLSLRPKWHIYSVLQDFNLLLHLRCFPLDMPLCWSYWPIGFDLTCRVHLFLLKQIEGKEC